MRVTRNRGASMTATEFPPHSATGAVELLRLHYRIVKYLKMMLCDSVWMSTKQLSKIYIYSGSMQFSIHCN
jgi:hypothetical protein